VDNPQPGSSKQQSENAWLNAATMFAYGNVTDADAQAYRGSLANVYGPAQAATRKAGATGRFQTRDPIGITIGADTKLPTGKFTTARFPGGIGGTAAYGPGGTGGGPATGGLYAPSPIPGLTPAQAYSVLGFAPALWERYVGHEPSIAEMIDIVRHGWNAQQLEAHLRQQPVRDESGEAIPGLTLGKRGDLYSLVASSQVQDILGRDVSPEELHWLLVNNVPIDMPHLTAWAQQMKDHAVWHGDPTVWRAAEKRAQSIWDSLGLIGKVDVNLVNDVVDGKVQSDAQITDDVRARPAPGYPDGTKVGDVERARTIAEAAKKNLFPGEPVSDTELHHLIGMSPDDVLKYYRSIVPKSSTTGLPVGIESDYKAMAKSVLAKAGIVDYEPTAEDLRFFALTKADPAAMLEHFAANPALAGAHPGLAFGMDSQQYKDALRGLGEAYGGVFPGQNLDAPKGKTGLAGYALSSGVGAGEFSSVLEQFRQERGRAPTEAEFKERRSRPTQAKPPGGQPSQPIVDPGTRATQRGTPAPAVGGKRAAA
jgi:hypothetical protein